MEQVYNGDEIVVRRTKRTGEDCCDIMDVYGWTRMIVPWDVAVEMAKGILKVEDDSTLKTYETNTTSTGMRAVE